MLESRLATVDARVNLRDCLPRKTAERALEKKVEKGPRGRRRLALEQSKDADIRRSPQSRCNPTALADCRTGQGLIGPAEGAMVAATGQLSAFFVPSLPGTWAGGRRAVSLAASPLAFGRSEMNWMEAPASSTSLPTKAREKEDDMIC